MIDLHFHCLPGVDDGPRDLAEATALCRAAAASGCTTIVATPHQRCPQWWNSDRAHLRSLHRQLQNAVGDLLHIELGAEIRIGAELLDDLEAADTSGILPLGTSRYLLLEFSRQGPWVDSEALVHELCLRDWRPIFAHPEFVPSLASDLHLMEHLAAAGAFFQITAMSLTGAFGHQNRKVVRQMVDAGVIHFVASDAHDTRRRPPGLLTAHRDLAKHWGEEVAWDLTLGNPGCVVEDKLIPASRLV